VLQDRLAGFSPVLIEIFLFGFCNSVRNAALNLAHNVGSYTQWRTAGDFLSSRKATRAERCTPKTNAAALDR